MEKLKILTSEFLQILAVWVLNYTKQNEAKTIKTTTEISAFKVKLQKHNNFNSFQFQLFLCDSFSTGMILPPRGHLAIIWRHLVVN